MSHVPYPRRPAPKMLHIRQKQLDREPVAEPRRELFDRIAHEADGIIVLGRTQTHPESATGLASGLLKMTTAGLGKQRGAQEAHSHGLWESVRAAPKLHLAKSKILFGVAMVENGIHQ